MEVQLFAQLREAAGANSVSVSTVPDTVAALREKIAAEGTPELREAVDLAKAARPIDIAPWLFCTDEGACYVNEATGEASGWDSMWQRFIARAKKETGVAHFTEHDLRAKTGSDADSLDHARALLSHVDERITSRVYRRKPERVKPLNRAFKLDDE